MSAIEHVLQANEAYARGFAGSPAKQPRLQLAVLTCMDTRLDPLAAFGLEIGDAHVIRNAGGLPTDDALRSLAISQRALGTREVAVVLHTGCGMDGFDDEAFRAQLSAEGGDAPTWRVPGFTDVQEQARRSAELVRDCPWLPHRDAVRGFVFDMATGAVIEIG